MGANHAEVRWVEALSSAWEAFGQNAVEELKFLAPRAAEISELAAAAYKACIEVPKDLDLCKVNSHATLDKMWQEKVQHGWGEPCWSEVYVISQLCAATSAFFQDPADSLAAMKALDLALIMGAPQELVSPFLYPVQHSIKEASSNASTAASERCDDELPQMRCIPDNLGVEACPYQLDDAKSIPRISADSLTGKSFKKDYWNSDKPVIITGAMENWEALTRWRELDWWVQNHGHRTIPLEVGLHGQKGWHERTASIREFVEEFLFPSMNGEPNAKVAYMAQHTLLDQIPSLRDAVKEPSFCTAASPDGAGIINAWIGTSGTKTPLHFDSYDNFLCQVAGSKYVRLYAQRETPLLYVDRSGGSSYTRKQHNISKVDVSSPDLDAFPDFPSATFSDSVLKPGEMLFIPAKYWHYVESLTPAVSVNFWF